MIRVNNSIAKAMEFTPFKKKETVTDDELMNAVMEFETVLAKQSGIIFHCLVRNFRNEYAHVLFAEDIGHLHSLNETISSHQEARQYFSLIEMESAQMSFHSILKDDFTMPLGFACIECGTFTLKEEVTIDAFKMASADIERNYLSALDNNLEHFVGSIEDKTVSEITIGKTYAKTKQECYGYLKNRWGTAFLGLAKTETFELDFWYLIA